MQVIEMNDYYAFISCLKIFLNLKTCQNFLKILLLRKINFISNFNILNNNYVRDLSLCSQFKFL